MKPAIAILFLLITGCGAGRQAETSDEQPELVLQTPLPTLGLTANPVTTKLTILFHVREDGSVADVKILGYTGDPRWESEARQAMKQWQFTAVRRDGVAVDAWVRCPVIVRVQDQPPAVIMLGELSSATEEKADSLYALIAQGIEFDFLVRQTAVVHADSEGSIPAAVDIAMYPRHIREKLLSLRTNEVARPLHVGDRFVIYKRYADNSTGILP